MNTSLSSLRTDMFGGIAHRNRRCTVALRYRAAVARQVLYCSSSNCGGAQRWSAAVERGGGAKRCSVVVEHIVRWSGRARRAVHCSCAPWRCSAAVQCRSAVPQRSTTKCCTSLRCLPMSVRVHARKCAFVSARVRPVHPCVGVCLHAGVLLSSVRACTRACIAFSLLVRVPCANPARVSRTYRHPMRSVRPVSVHACKRRMRAACVRCVRATRASACSCMHASVRMRGLPGRSRRVLLEKLQEAGRHLHRDASHVSA